MRIVPKFSRILAPRAHMLGLLPLLLGMTACGEHSATGDPGPVGSSDEAIRNGFLLTGGEMAWKSTVNVLTPVGSKESVCTGTIISKNYVLTAAHCNAVAHKTRVGFYLGATPSPYGIMVRRVVTKPGVVPPNQLYDSAGNFADLALLELDGEIPRMYEPAEIPWPADFDRSSQKWAVGAGEHDGVAGALGQLRWVEDQIASPDDSQGYFFSRALKTNHGDSGGPLYRMGYQNVKVLGVLNGSGAPPGATAEVSKYTSIAFPPHEAWISATVWGID